jgi:hypothetical protein
MRLKHLRAFTSIHFAACFACIPAALFDFAWPTSSIALAPPQFNLTVLSSDLDDSEVLPVINGDNVLWIGRHGSERKMYRYAISTGARTVLTGSSFQINRPAVDGNYAVWEGAGITLYDLSNSTALPISTDSRALTAQISGNNVAWLEGRPQDSLTRLMHYNIATQTTQQLIGFSSVINDLQISGNDVVWDQRTGSGASTSEIFHFNLVTGVATRLTTNSIPDYYPQVSSGNVVWQTFDTEATSEVFRRNLATGVNERLTNNSESDRTPEISGTNVVWQEGFAGSAVNNVYHRDLANGITTRGLAT